MIVDDRRIALQGIQRHRSFYDPLDRLIVIHRIIDLYDLEALSCFESFDLHCFPCQLHRESPCFIRRSAFCSFAAIFVQHDPFCICERSSIGIYLERKCLRAFFCFLMPQFFGQIQVLPFIIVRDAFRISVFGHRSADAVLPCFCEPILALFDLFYLIGGTFCSREQRYDIPCLDPEFAVGICLQLFLIQFLWRSAIDPDAVYQPVFCICQWFPIRACPEGEDLFLDICILGMVL